jgi:hypothetical protein
MARNLSFCGLNPGLLFAMKRPAFLLAAMLCTAVSVQAQTPINAPAGWKTQTRAGGATVFTPPGLSEGEVYSVTTYESQSMEGKTLEEFLSQFAGPVGQTAGKLARPLEIKVRDGRVVSGTGTYKGPNGTALGVMFIGVTLDGGINIHLSRTLFSGQGELLSRYQNENKALMSALMTRAKGEAGRNIVQVPPVVREKLKVVGGALVPGVYAGNQYDGEELRQRFRVYLYPSGEYRLCDQNDQDIRKRFFDEQVGNYKYNRVSGQLNIDWTQALGFYSDDVWCYYGRGTDGKPTIYAEDNVGFGSKRTLLKWVAPPTKRVSKSQESARRAAIEEERNRYKWVTVPGKGVHNAKIAAILLDSRVNGASADETVYLLLKDGTIYADLPVPPDELDVIRSRQKEPAKWGKWRKVGAGYKVSWAGAPYQTLPGRRVLPAPAHLKLSGRWGTGRASNDIITSSYSLWGVTFTKNGRFRKDSRGGSSTTIGFGDQATRTASGYDDEGSFGGGSGPGFAVSSSQKKKNPNGAREGDYMLNGYVLTLRYDNGKVVRLPFFFRDAGRKGLWFEGASMEFDDKK